MTRTAKVKEKINARINAANGRSRERQLGEREIAQVLAEAIRDGYGYTTGGSVAKAYGRFGRAESTKAFAVANGPDYVALSVARGNALGSAVTWAGPTQATDKSCRAWAQRQTLYTLRDWLVLTRAECRAFIAGLSELKITDVPDVAVTIADSLAAGNCRHVTERVAGWFAPRTEVSAKVLARAIMTREPLLATFCKRAIREAARRVSV